MLPHCLPGTTARVLHGVRILVQDVCTRVAACCAASDEKRKRGMHDRHATPTEACPHDVRLDRTIGTTIWAQQAGGMRHDVRAVGSRHARRLCG
ncbi:hypothetical protein F511_34892 [Dorcoceras hygrometricum]|uniref:Uncharacterized protein n=1 Tax=Dorcoceras hygrometricum TaxID=472368 RepID=A0A2Z7AD81_9LAMI|nr:hypothetical protein F511_34892 [Dorcoceras hygrometricum]